MSLALFLGVLGFVILLLISPRVTLLLSAIAIFVYGFVLMNPHLLPTRSTISNIHLEKSTNPIHPYDIKLATADGGRCSGAVISKDYILTAAHCVDNLDEEVGILLEDDTFITKGRVVAMVPYRDVAIIRGDFNDFHNIKADFDGEFQTNLGNTNVVSCGFPGGGNKEYCVVLQYKSNYFFKHSFSGGIIYRGMSGGPVFIRTMKNCILVSGSPVNKDCVIEDVLIGVNSAVTEDVVIAGSITGILNELR